MDDLDQRLGRDGAGIVMRGGGIDHVFADMILDHLGDEPVERAATRGGLLQDTRALRVFLDRAFERFDLFLQTADPVARLLSTS
ncbi:hypothetical protein HMP09_3225 [Sphingomonas sp. HMP9]|nr:hypothetical protein HMP09_3225 [Sphingomonas sp. HMP9]